MLQITPLNPLFAAKIAGLDLRRRMSSDLTGEVAAALDRYAVLVFSDQHVTTSEQIAFSERFGVLETTAGSALQRPGQSRLGEPRIAEVSNLGADGTIRQPDDRWRLMQKANELWHTDSSFKRRPGKISILSAHECPAHGGETEFVDLRAAYDDLDEATKLQVADLQVTHSIARSRSLVGYDDLAPQAARLFPPVIRPLAHRHPGSGRVSLYLASHASDVIGLPSVDGRVLLDRLIKAATRPKFIFRHSWHVGDLVMWDNRCTMHRGCPYNDLTERRDMRRTTVVEDYDVPFAELAS